MSKIPILVLAFNRADHVRQAMEPIRKYQPEKIYLACDGPRTSKEGEAEAVNATRQTMLEMIDWPCEVKTLFRDENLGCAKGVNNAISWFFENEESGIICEDDVVLGDHFFTLCEELLPRYANEERIMEISARNESYRTDKNNTYLYAQCYHCWGWATWRRAWRKMDMSMSAVPWLKVSYLIKRLGIFRGTMMYKYFNDGYANLESFNSWATRWYLSILVNDGLVICPGPNLSINIGLLEGTHYDSQDKNRPGYDLQIGKLEWPIVYNDSLMVDKKQKKYDNKFFFDNRMFGLKKIIAKKIWHKS